MKMLFAVNTLGGPGNIGVLVPTTRGGGEDEFWKKFAYSEYSTYLKNG